MSIFIGQTNIHPGQPQENKQELLALIEQAKAQAAELIVFPELAISGPCLGDLLLDEGFLAECEAVGRALAAAAGETLLLFSNVHRGEEGQLYNQVWLARDGALQPISTPLAPSFLPGAYDLFEKDVPMQCIDLTLDGQPRRIAVLLGDQSQTELPENALSADLLIDLSLRPVFFDRDLTPPLALAGEYITANGCGLVNSGSSCYLLAGCSSFYREGELLASALSFTPGLYGQHGLAEQPEEDIFLRLSLVEGTRLFLEQIHCGKVIIGLSGGIDSALAACVYSQALGSENVYTVTMPTQYNSATTKGLAAALAAALGCPFSVIPVEQSALELRSAVESAIFRNGAGESSLSISPLGWENLMARERGRILAAASSAVGGIFTCNGNKAELSVGYATFYGDLAGGFAAQADLWKYQVYQASRAFQSLLPDTPMDKIAAVRPSAELSWKQDVNKGLGDPLQYDYHDYLLRYWVERGGGLLDCLDAYAAGELEELLGCKEGLAKQYFPDAAAFVSDLERWWKQYRGIGIAKRIQAPPLLALSSHPFGETLPQSQTPVWFDEAYLQRKSQLCK